MDSADLKMLLKEANKYLKDPDTIIDPYDMTFVWASENVNKKSGRNLVGERVASTSEDPQGIEDLNKMSAEATVIDYRVKEKELVFKTGTGKKTKATINFVVIEFNKQPYLVTKIIRLED